jgi:hypothetical protein
LAYLVTTGPELEARPMQFFIGKLVDDAKAEQAETRQYRLK